MPFSYTFYSSGQKYEKAPPRQSECPILFYPCRLSARRLFSPCSLPILPTLAPPLFRCCSAAVSFPVETAHRNHRNSSEAALKGKASRPLQYSLSRQGCRRPVLRFVSALLRPCFRPNHGLFPCHPPFPFHASFFLRPFRPVEDRGITTSEPDVSPKQAANRVASGGKAEVRIFEEICCCSSVHGSALAGSVTRNNSLGRCSCRIMSIIRLTISGCSAAMSWSSWRSEARS